MSAAVLVAGFLVQAGLLTTAQQNADTTLEKARLEWRDRAEAMGAHGLGITNASWDNVTGRVTLTVNNTGTVPMNASRVDVLLDGADSDADVVSRQVAGATTDVWPQGKLLTVVVAAASKPADAEVVSPWGLGSAWRGI